ncbi:HNH endonuclease signature motif containing protein [Actinoplanes sp. ATCC 53533]|uniref:HNH endonuclease signature motif containing protein n=1 Tax=Actinoplanes sp. ATCC 53533 TaxID=1288362 RepID=UPI0013158387|nr:HNH endonuclease signature motif containing protein [Actinoplanes sp. ATCC 53533]
MLELLSEARRAAAACAAAPAWAVPDRDLVECLRQAWAAVQQLTAVTAHLISQAQSRGLPRAHAATSTEMWLRHQLRVSPGTAARLVTLTEALQARPVLDTAVCAGTVSAEQAMTIAATVADLPAEVGREVTDKAEAMLVEWAGDFDAVTLGKMGGRILEHVAPEVAEQREADFLARQEARAHRKRGFTLSPLGNGQVRLSGYLDTAGAATVTAALDPLCHPRHDPAGARTPAQRRADALVDVCTGALRDGTDLPGHGGDPAQVVVTIPFTTLTEQVRPAGQSPAGQSSAGQSSAGQSSAGQSRPAGQSPAGQSRPAGQSPAGQSRPAGQSWASQANTHAGTGARSHAGANADDGPGWLDTGAPISPAEARRMACDARILPAVLGGDGHVLDLGRTRRLFTGPLRRALILRDRGCVFPGCDRPARWAEGHHLVSWADGGTTTLTNACLICRLHHRLLHNNSGWQARLGPDGHPEFLPPATLDPERRPQHNTYHRRQ